MSTVTGEVQLSEDERYAIDVFEKLADADLFTATDEDGHKFPWTDIWWKNRFGWMWELKREECGFGDDAQQAKDAPDVGGEGRNTEE